MTPRDLVAGIMIASPLLSVVLFINSMISYAERERKENMRVAKAADNITYNYEQVEATLEELNNGLHILSEEINRDQARISDHSTNAQISRENITALTHRADETHALAQQEIARRSKRIRCLSDSLALADKTLSQLAQEDKAAPGFFASRREHKQTSQKIDRLKNQIKIEHQAVQAIRNEKSKLPAIQSRIAAIHVIARQYALEIESAKAAVNNEEQKITRFRDQLEANLQALNESQARTRRLAEKYRQRAKSVTLNPFDRYLGNDRDTDD